MIVGIDPGVHGSICFLGQDGKIVELADMPSIEIKVGKTYRNRVSPQGLADMFKPWVGIEMVVIESVGGITGQSASAAFTFGHGCGLVQGVVVGLGLPIAMMPAQRWKKAAGLPKDKGAARMRAQQLWPLQAKLFARAKDDGRAEAALIARHYWSTIPRANAA